MPDHTPACNVQPLAQNLDSLTTLAESLKAALEALTAFMQSCAADAPDNGIPEEEYGAEQPDQQDRPENNDSNGEIRSYRIPPHALEEEQEYLRLTGAESSFDLMGRTLDRFYLLLTLMQHTTISEEMPEDFIERLGDHLQESLEMLERLLSFFDAMEPVDGQTDE